MEAENHTGRIILFPVAKCWAPAPGRGDHHSGFRAGRRAVSPASPVCWAERSGIFIGNFQVRALIFLLVYNLGGQGGEVMVFYQGASKLL